MFHKVSFHGCTRVLNGVYCGSIGPKVRSSRILKSLIGWVRLDFFSVSGFGVEVFQGFRFGSSVVGNARMGLARSPLPDDLSPH